MIFYACSLQALWQRSDVSCVVKLPQTFIHTYSQTLFFVALTEKSLHLLVAERSERSPWSRSEASDTNIGPSKKKFDFKHCMNTCMHENVCLYLYVCDCVCQFECTCPCPCVRVCVLCEGSISAEPLRCSGLSILPS